LEDRHDLADALEGDLGILGLAVPDPPVLVDRAGLDNYLQSAIGQLAG
jgi:hypothetical protein